jgi:hypothetical protein
MILGNKLEKPYEKYTIREKVWLVCDYCGKEFQRIKKSRERNNININKDGCGDKECKKAKMKDINFKLYGQDNYFLTDEFNEKKNKTNLENYGETEYFKSDDFQIKRKEKLNDKYGVDSPLQNKEIKKKQQDTCEKIYGKRNYAQTDEFAPKVAESNIEKYGVSSPMKLEKYIDMREETCEKKYGKKSYTQTEEYWERRIETCKEKYGVEHPSQLKSNRDQAKATTKEQYGVENYSQTDEFKKNYKNYCLETIGVPSYLCLQENRQYGKKQSEITEWLNSLGFNFKLNDYSILGSKEIDIYDGKALAIEFCGLYWHNEFSPQPRDKNYHYQKYITCLEKSVKLITMYEDEWNGETDICKSMLKSMLGLYDKRIHARKCKIEQIENKDFYDFCKVNHVMGGNTLAKVCLGLIYDDELVGGVSLGRHHRGNIDLVLSRLCFKKNIQIVGGTSKLFSGCRKWMQENGHDSIISWSDNRWSQGNIYKTLGFELDGEIEPDYCYVNADKPYFRLSKQSQMKSNTGCSKDMTIREWCVQHRLARIWDCGKKRWKFKLV